MTIAKLCCGLRHEIVMRLDVMSFFVTRWCYLGHYKDWGGLTTSKCLLLCGQLLHLSRQLMTLFPRWPFPRSFNQLPPRWFSALLAMSSATVPNIVLIGFCTLWNMATGIQVRTQKKDSLHIDVYPASKTSDAQLVVMMMTFDTPKDWYRNSLFHTIIKSREHKLLLRIDGGVALNVIDPKTIWKLHPNPYIIEEFDGSRQRVTEQCHMAFSTANYTDKVFCDCRHTHYNGFSNTYTSTSATILMILYRSHSRIIIYKWFCSSCLLSLIGKEFLVLHVC